MHDSTNHKNANAEKSVHFVCTTKQTNASRFHIEEHARGVQCIKHVRVYVSAHEGV